MAAGGRTLSRRSDSDTPLNFGTTADALYDFLEFLSFNIGLILQLHACRVVHRIGGVMTSTTYLGITQTFLVPLIGDSSATFKFRAVSSSEGGVIVGRVTTFRAAVESVLPVSVDAQIALFTRGFQGKVPSIISVLNVDIISPLSS